MHCTFTNVKISLNAEIVVCIVTTGLAHSLRDPAPGLGGSALRITHSVVTWSLVTS